MVLIKLVRKSTHMATNTLAQKQFQTTTISSISQVYVRSRKCTDHHTCESQTSSADSAQYFLGIKNVIMQWVVLVYAAEGDSRNLSLRMIRLSVVLHVTGRNAELSPHRPSSAYDALGISPAIHTFYRMLNYLKGWVR